MAGPEECRAGPAGFRESAELELDDSDSDSETDSFPLVLWVSRRYSEGSDSVSEGGCCD